MFGRRAALETARLTCQCGMRAAQACSSSEPASPLVTSLTSAHMAVRSRHTRCGGGGGGGSWAEGSGPGPVTMAPIALSSRCTRGSTPAGKWKTTRGDCHRSRLQGAEATRSCSSACCFKPAAPCTQAGQPATARREAEQQKWHNIAAPPSHLMPGNLETAKTQYKQQADPSRMRAADPWCGRGGRASGPSPG